MSPDLALHRAIFDHLRADADLAALLGDPPRVHDETPAQPVWPLVVFGRAETRPWGGLDGEGLEHALTLTALSRFDGAEEARAIVAALRARLHNADLALDGWRLVNLRVTYGDVFRAADGRDFRGVIRVRAVTEPI
ncbi:MAG: DUF3168 domain-containing protein [Caulobacter sp.]|nr:DUF3168 domain-containing protein [Caulobacter sp.]